MTTITLIDKSADLLAVDHAAIAALIDTEGLDAILESCADNLPGGMPEYGEHPHSVARRKLGSAIRAALATYRDEVRI